MASAGYRVRPSDKSASASWEIGTTITQVPDPSPVSLMVKLANKRFEPLMLSIAKQNPLGNMRECRK
jgi:hypothetical protein